MKESLSPSPSATKTGTTKIKTKTTINTIYISSGLYNKIKQIIYSDLEMREWTDEFSVAMYRNQSKCHPHLHITSISSD